MAVYVAYSDEAAVNDPYGEFLVAGYVASETEWPSIVTAWQERVLEGNPVLPYLHMTEIRSASWRNKHGIGYYAAERRVDEAVRVLRSSGALTAFASVMRRLDLKEVFHDRHKRKKDVERGLDEPDYLCYMGFISYALNRIYERHSDVEKVNFIVSVKKEVSKGLNDVMSVARYYLSKNRPELLPLLGDLIPVSMELHLPLQAADVLCWHMQRYYGHKFDRVEEGRIWALIKERPGNLHEWPREELEEAFQAFKGSGIHEATA